MKITALVEDTSKNKLKSEHGLSLYIESGQGKILFDTSQSKLFAENAEKLGIDLSQVDFAVISHGHYDHGGGLEKFLQINKSAPVYISENAFGAFYNGEKYIGLDKSLKENERLSFISENTHISDGAELFVSTSVSNNNFSSFGLSEEKGGEKQPDTFAHEIYLQLESGGKKVLFSGCSHRGIINILNYFKPDVFIGGFHLLKVEDKKALEEAARKLSAFDTDFYTCHCTGEQQYNYLKEKVKSLNYLRTGESIII